MRRHLALFTAFLLVWTESMAAEPAPGRFEFAERHMGTEFVIRLYAPSQSSASRAAAAAFARIAELDTRLSDYQSESELSRLSRSAGQDQAMEVSDDLWTVLVRARDVSRVSDGAFDVTVGPYVRLWRRARRTGQMPSEERLSDARQVVGYRLVEFFEDARSVRLTREGMRLDLGGIAKGFAADEALDVLRQRGLRTALIDAGGDLAVGEPPPGEDGWRIAVVSPAEATGTALRETTQPGQGGAQDSSDEPFGSERVLLVSECGVATSGDVYQFVEFEGTRYSHILDPRTGLGLTTPGSVTVVASDCTTADAFASAVSVLGPDAGLALIENTMGAAALIVRNESSGLRRYSSKRWESLLLPEGIADREEAPPPR